ncbi:MAG: hypothetical protein U5R48_13705 [Gammaproteobacteria bacterium]|nr:hypothetical protein [Gammaproteobacteria bacterium]
MTNETRTTPSVLQRATLDRPRRERSCCWRSARSSPAPSPQQDGHFGFWSVLPPLVAIVLAFWTREVIPALFLGIAVGGFVAGRPNIVQEFMLPAIGTQDFALILLVYLWSWAA